MLETKRKTMIPIEFKGFFFNNFREKCIETHLEFLSRMAQSRERNIHFRIDGSDFGEDLMPKQISRNICVIVGFIVSKCYTILFRVGENLIFCDRQKRPNIAPSERFYADETRKSCSLCDTVEDGFCLIIAMVGSSYEVCVVFFSDVFEPFFSNISRTFFDGCFCDFRFSFYICLEYFKNELILSTIVLDDIFISFGSFSEIMIDMCDDDARRGEYAFCVEVEEYHRIRSTGTSHNDFFIVSIYMIFYDLLDKI